MSALQYLKSKSVWNQIVGSAAIIGSVFGLDIPQEQQAAIVAGLAALFGVLGIVIRRFTTQPLSEK